MAIDTTIHNVIRIEFMRRQLGAFESWEFTVRTRDMKPTDPPHSFNFFINECDKSFASKKMARLLNEQQNVLLHADQEE